MLAFINKVLSEHTRARSLPYYRQLLLYAPVAEPNGRKWLDGPQSRKYLLSGPYRKKFANPSSHTSVWEFIAWNNIFVATHLCGKSILKLNWLSTCVLDDLCRGISQGSVGGGGGRAGKAWEDCSRKSWSQSLRRREAAQSWRGGLGTHSGPPRPFNLSLALFGYWYWSHPVIKSRHHRHVNNRAACAILTELPSPRSPRPVPWVSFSPWPPWEHCFIG